MYRSLIISNSKKNFVKNYLVKSIWGIVYFGHNRSNLLNRNPIEWSVKPSIIHKIVAWVRCIIWMTTTLSGQYHFRMDVARYREKIMKFNCWLYIPSRNSSRLDLLVPIFDFLLKMKVMNSFNFEISLYLHLR